VERKNQDLLGNKIDSFIVVTKHNEHSEWLKGRLLKQSRYITTDIVMDKRKFFGENIK
jgi:hypothetical protein